MICLTFDSDYVAERDMNWFLKNFQFPGNGTFFLEKPFDVDWGSHEIGPHPFLEGAPSTWLEVTEKLRGSLSCPAAGWRSHSLVTSQVASAHLAKAGYLYTSATSSIFEIGIRPMRQPWGLWELPIYYMDNADFCFGNNWPKSLNHKVFDQSWIDASLNQRGLFIFDFHPLHLMLNTPSYEFYQNARDSIVNGGARPYELAYEGEGTRTFFESLVGAMDRLGVVSVTCQQAIRSFEQHGDASLVPGFRAT